jgi:copper chaperone CopZ
MVLRVSGMHCASCIRHVSRALSQEPGVTSAKVDLIKGLALVEYDVSSTNVGAVLEAAARAGYQAEIADP